EVVGVVVRVDDVVSAEAGPARALPARAATAGTAATAAPRARNERRFGAEFGDMVILLLPVGFRVTAGKVNGRHRIPVISGLGYMKHPLVRGHTLLGCGSLTRHRNGRAAGRNSRSSGLVSRPSAAERER